jgi:hypothetical protein
VPTSTPQCDACGEALTPRGGLPPRFCPRCGRRLFAGPGPLPPGAESPQPYARVRPQGVAGTAVAALVVGIVSLFSACALVGLSAILLGVHARKRIEQSHGQLTGDGLAIAGIVLGIIGTGLWAAVCAAAL